MYFSLVLNKLKAIVDCLYMYDFWRLNTTVDSNFTSKEDSVTDWGWYEVLSEALSVLSNSASILTSGVALYLLYKNRKGISKVFKGILNYSLQITLNELRIQLEKLNHLNANLEEEKESVLNIFYEIQGQIQGNQTLSTALQPVLKKLQSLLKNPAHLNEFTKRSIVSEMREAIKSTDLQILNV